MQKELKYCCSCNFTKKKFKKHQDNLRGTFADKARPLSGIWDTYKPMIYKDRLLGKWIIECQNCGMEVIFSETEEDSIDLWNDLCRKDR